MLFICTPFDIWLDQLGKSEVGVAIASDSTSSFTFMCAKVCIKETLPTGTWQSHFFFKFDIYACKTVYENRQQMFKGAK